MKLITESDGIRLKSKLYLNIILFMLIVIPLLLVLSVIEESIHHYVHPNSLMLSFIFAGLISFSYKKSIAFSKSQSKLKYSKGFIGLRKIREYKFQDIDRIILHTFQPISIHGQLNIFGININKLSIALTNGDNIHVDKSTDVSCMKKIADTIASISSSRINNTKE